MSDVDFWGSVEVGDGLGDFDDFEIRAGGEVQFFRGVGEESFSATGQTKERRDLMRGKGRVIDVGF